MTNKEAAIRIVKELRKAGWQALLAGGCVRDMLLKRRPKDYDVATDARPQEVVRLFKRTLKVGAKFGVVMVLTDNQQTEVATFRAESGYADGRHPGKVHFTDAKEDALRRDFTINGMFYDPVAGKVIDFVNGQDDLAAGTIRTIGKAEDRFGEDYLRMLRAVRFSTELDFDIEPKTWQAVCGYAERINCISAERIAIELEGILTHPNRARGAGMLVESGLLAAIFPAFVKKQAEVGIKVLAFLPANIDWPLALAALLADCQTRDALDRTGLLKLSGAHAKHLKFLLSHRGRLLEADMSLAELKMLVASPYYADLYEFQKAIQRAHNHGIALLSRLARRARDLDIKHLQPKPLLNGHELIALGAVPGPMVGLVAREMYIAQLSEEIHTAAQAEKWVRKFLAEHRKTRK